MVSDPPVERLAEGAVTLRAASRGAQVTNVSTS
jgi:hypothetical protein